MDKETKLLHFRFSEDEIEKLNINSSKCGLSKSSYVRMLVRGYEPKPLASEEFYKDMSAIHTALNNLEQDGNNLELVESIRELLFDIKVKLLKPDTK